MGVFWLHYNCMGPSLYMHSLTEMLRVTWLQSASRNPRITKSSEVTEAASSKYPYYWPKLVDKQLVKFLITFWLLWSVINLCHSFYHNPSHVNSSEFSWALKVNRIELHIWNKRAAHSLWSISALCAVPALYSSSPDTQAAINSAFPRSVLS